MVRVTLLSIVLGAASLLFVLWIVLVGSFHSVGTASVHGQSSVATSSIVEKVHGGLIGPVGDFSVTLVTQSSPERLWLLRETCDRWRGPIVVVVFVQSADLAVSGAHLRIPLADGTTGMVGGDICPNARVITHHPALDGEDPATARFPVNRLRNIGVAAVHTSHFFYLDIDFWPMHGLEQQLALYAASDAYGKVFAEERQAVIVPAFNFLSVSNRCPYAVSCRQTYQRTAPQTFPQLQDCLDKRGCQVRVACVIFVFCLCCSRSLLMGLLSKLQHLVLHIALGMWVS